MRCCCDDVGPELMKCPRCKMEMAPLGRSVGVYACGSYCDCAERLWNEPGLDNVIAFLKETQKRSGLWPGERWGDSLPCLGDVKCEGIRLNPRS